MSTTTETRNQSVPFTKEHLNTLDGALDRLDGATQLLRTLNVAGGESPLAIMEDASTMIFELFQKFGESLKEQAEAEPDKDALRVEDLDQLQELIKAAAKLRGIDLMVVRLDGCGMSDTSNGER